MCNDAQIAVEANMTGKAHVNKSCESAGALTAMSGRHRWSDRENSSLSHTYVARAISHVEVNYMPTAIELHMFCRRD